MLIILQIWEQHFPKLECRESSFPKRNGCQYNLSNPKPKKEGPKHIYHQLTCPKVQSKVRLKDPQNTLPDRYYESQFHEQMLKQTIFSLVMSSKGLKRSLY